MASWSKISPEQAARFDAALPQGVERRSMFGCPIAVVNGNMFTGVVGGELMVRLGEDGAEAALRRDHVREMDFTGRPLKSMVYVATEGLQGAALAEWVVAGASFALGLPAKCAPAGR